MSTLVRFILGIMTFITIAGANPVQLEYTKAELLSDVKAIQPGKPFWVVLKLTMRPGWHTYWQNPGDSGLATAIDWQLPQGFKASAINWLPPHRINAGTLTNFGYSNESFHLVEITPAKDISSQPQTLVAKASWLVCEDTCIPEEAELTLTLPVNAESAATDFSEHQALFSQLRSELPKATDIKGQYEVKDKYLNAHIPLEIIGNITINQLELFPNAKDIIRNAAAQEWSVSEGKIKIRVPQGLINAKGDIQALIKINSTEPRAVHSFTLNLVAAPPAAAITKETTNIWQVLLFAFLGGLILNAMPCVFPILSLKALGIAQKSHGKSSFVRHEGVLYTFGVLISFAVLSGLLIALKYTGQSVGWGFQMQSPTFVAVMVYLMFLIGLSLSGAFYFPMLFANATTGKHPSSSFWVGVLAVLVATPCTAPFMGIAVGYALTQSALILALIFLSLGIGFAFPYLLITLFPPILKLLPKPGPWMETFKELLAFPMYATVVWLLWVLTLQAGTRGLILTSFGLVISAFSIWLWQKLRLKNIIAKTLWLVILIAGSAWPLAFLSSTVNENHAPVTAFSLEKLNQLRTEKKAVFVNVTAAWCITCKVNEVILKGQSISDLFKNKDISYLEADWTNQNSEISNYLTSFGRSGVPLYIYYPKSGEPVVLPQLLTESIVIDALSGKGK